MSFDVIKSFVDKVSNHLRHFRGHADYKLASWSEFEETKDYYGIMAPLESYMNVPQSKRLLHVWDCLDIGDFVIGRIISKLDRGLIVRLLCFDGGKSQDIEALEIKARCPRSEISTVNNHEDPLSQFSVNDLIRGEVINVHRREQKMTISLIQSSSRSYRLALGILSEENLPVAYKRMSTSTESYDKLLHLSTGFYNPNVIDFLKNRLVKGHITSFIDELKDFSCSSAELAPALRKRQSAKVAQRSVTKGVNFYRKGMMLEALQELNLALDLDSTNVDALVARGALYANKRTFAKAIGDFEKALSIDNLNKNARKYLIEVLVERAKSIELDIKDMEQVKEAARLYKQALTLDPDCREAKTALGLLEKSEKEYHKRFHQTSSTDSASDSDNSISSQKSDKNATIFKVRQLLEHDVGSRKHSKEHAAKHPKQRRHHSSSTSSSSSSSSSSSNTSSSSNGSSESPVSKKRRLSSNCRHSESEDKRRHGRNASSSSYHDSTDSKKTLTQRRPSRSSFDRSDEISSDRSKFSHSEYKSQKRRQSSDRNSYTEHSRRSSAYFSNRPTISERRTSYNSHRKAINDNSHRRRSVTDKSPRRDVAQASKSDSRKAVVTDASGRKNNDKPTVPITKVTKDNFSSILDQISKFEKRKSVN